MYNMTKISKDQPHIFNVEGQIEELWQLVAENSRVPNNLLYFYS